MERNYEASRATVYGGISNIVTKDEFENFVGQLHFNIEYNEKDTYSHIDDFWCYINYYYDSSLFSTDGNTSKYKPHAKLCTILIRNKNISRLLTDKNCLSHTQWLCDQAHTYNQLDNVQLIVVGSRQKKHLINEKNDKYLEIMCGKSSRPKAKSQSTSSQKNETITLDDNEIEQKLIELQFDFDLNVTYCSDTSSYNKWLNCALKSAIRADGLSSNEKQIQNNILTLDKMISAKIQPNTNEWIEKCWIQQLTQFRSIDDDTARSIASQYPTMFHLRNAIVENSPNLSFLENIIVNKGYGVLASKSKVGPIIAKQLEQVLTSSDPNQFVH